MRLEFKYGTRNISFNLIYRKRKSMSIEVEADGEINVISPLGFDEDIILGIRLILVDAFIRCKLLEEPTKNDSK